MALDVVDEPASEVYWGDTATRFHLDVYTDEWGVMFIHGGKTSHVRKIGDLLDGSGDPHGLQRRLPALSEIATLVRALEAEHGIAFKRDHALVRTNLAGGKKLVGAWIATL
jgi:hypothetical protein